MNYYEMGALNDDQETNLNAGDPAGGGATAADVLAYCCAHPDNCPEENPWRTHAPFSVAKPAGPCPVGAGKYAGTGGAGGFMSKKIGIFPVPLLIGAGILVLWFALRKK